jgi:hypothetical protein
MRSDYLVAAAVHRHSHGVPAVHRTRFAVVALSIAAGLALGFVPPGSWAELEIPAARGHDYKEADLTAAKTNLQQLHAIFRRDKALDPPAAGLLVQPDANVGRGWSRSRMPYRKDVVPAFYELLFLHPSQHCAQGTCRTVNGEGPGLRVFVNMPERIFPWAEVQSQSVLGDPHGPDEMYLAPQQVGTVAGFPLYANGYVVLTRRTQSPFVPVTQGDFVRSHAERLRAMAGSGANAAIARQVAALDQELVGLSPSERAAPAYCCNSTTHPSGRMAATDQHARMVVRLNKDFFDAALDAGAFQLLVVGTALQYDREYGGNTAEPAGRQLFADVQGGLDWKALADLLR